MQQDETGNPLKPNQMTDETPWAQLASLALFKLFNDWQAQGYIVPPELLRIPDYYNNQGTATKTDKVITTSTWKLIFISFHIRCEFWRHQTS